MTASAVGRRSVVRRPRLLAVLLSVTAALLLLPAAPASAHAVLVASDPADGARVEAAPAVIRLTFDEPIALPRAGAVVLSSTGDRIDRGAARLAGDGRTVEIPLRAEVPEGVYSTSWRVLSADSHVVTGSMRFGVGRDADAVEGPVSAATPLDGAGSAATGLLYLGLSVGLGAPAAVALFWPSLARPAHPARPAQPPRPGPESGSPPAWRARFGASPRARGGTGVRGGRRVRRIAVAGVLVAGVATLVDLLLRGPKAAGGGWAGVLGLQDLAATVASPAGVVLVVRIALLALVVVLLVRLPRIGRGRTVGGEIAPRAVLAALLTAVLVTVALLGHATDGAAWLLVPAAVLHLAAMTVWLGGLVVLVAVVLPRLRRTPAAALRVLRRWSPWAFVCVGVLVVTGEVQAFPVVAPLPSLWATDYGRLLLLKLALVAVVLVVAAALQRVVVAGGARPRALLRRALAVELVGVFAVLAVTGVVTGIATAAETYGPAAARTVAIGPDRLLVDVDRTRRGAAVIRIRAEEAGGADVRLSSLTGALSTEGIAALDVDFRREGRGWRSTDAALPVSGEWTLTVQAELDATAAYAAEVAWPVW